MSFFGDLVEKWRSHGDLARRVVQFREELAAARRSKRPEAVAALSRRREELELSEDDVALELELVDALLESWGLEGRLAEGQAAPTVETQHRAISDEACYFLAAVNLPDTEAHETGKLFFTPTRCLFVGSRTRSLGWRRIKSVKDDERDLIVIADADLLRFRCNTFGESLRGAVIGRWLVGKV